MRVHIVRHGETRKNNLKIKKKRSKSMQDIKGNDVSEDPNHKPAKIAKITKADATDKDSELNGNGYGQCARVAMYFTERTIGQDIAIYSSPVTRTVQSSRQIMRSFGSNSAITHSLGANIGLRLDKRLYDSDDDTITKIKELKYFINELYVEHHAKQKENQTTHLEQRFKDRIGNETVIVIVTHNHIIDLFHKMVHGIDSDKRKFYNASITTIDVNGMLDTENLSSKEPNLTAKNWDVIDHLLFGLPIDEIARIEGFSGELIEIRDSRISVSDIDSCDTDGSYYSGISSSAHASTSCTRHEGSDAPPQ